MLSLRNRMLAAAISERVGGNTGSCEMISSSASLCSSPMLIVIGVERLGEFGFIWLASPIVFLWLASPLLIGGSTGDASHDVVLPVEFATGEGVAKLV